MNKTEINYESALNRFKDAIDLQKDVNYKVKSLNLLKEQVIETATDYFNGLTFSSQKMLLASLKNNEEMSSWVGYLKPLLKKQEYVKSVKAFDLNEINKLRETVKTMSLKHQAVILTMLNTGCRKFEINAIWTNFQPDIYTLKIDGKGSKTAKIYLDDELHDILLKWTKSNDFKLFSEKHLENITKQVFKKAGLTGNCHDIRRAFATNLRNHNVPIEQIQILLRHDDIRTTIGYIKVTDTDIFESLKNRYLNVDEYINETNYRTVALDLIVKNQKMAAEIESLKKYIDELEKENKELDPNW